MERKKELISSIKYGLIGSNLSYSFSKSYFENKFKAFQLHNHTYTNIVCATEVELKAFMKKEIYEYNGVNVTIPYKEKIITLLDGIKGIAKKVNAVNTLVINEQRIIGYNTDVYGFTKALQPLLHSDIKKALVLGTGGASKAVSFALKQIGIDIQFVSRNTTNSASIGYKQIDQKCMQEHLLVINCTPLGTYPDINQAPQLPYQYITKNHIVFDLVYNPQETLFMQLAKEQGASISNGMEMLKFQAEKAWELWNT